MADANGPSRPSSETPGYGRSGADEVPPLGNTGEPKRNRTREEAGGESARAIADRLLVVEQQLAVEFAAKEALAEHFERVTAVLRDELAAVDSDRKRQARVIAGMLGSLSWRLTRPLRLAKRLLGSKRDY
jgi:hypothetical protein